MRTFTKTILCGLSAVALLAAGGAASAQTPMPMKDGAMKDGAMKDGAMKDGAMQHGAMSDHGMAHSNMKMSRSHMRMMKKCMAMGHDKMMANAKCEAMADKHPDMMKSDGMMKK